MNAPLNLAAIQGHFDRFQASVRGDEYSPDAAAFAANDIPDLLAEVGRLRGVLAGMLGSEGVTADQAMEIDETLGTTPPDPQDGTEEAGT